VEKSPAKALEHALKGANAGSLDAANQVGLFYQFGYGLNQDKIAAAGWFNFAAQYDHPAGLSNFGQCYEVGQGVKPNMQIAAKYYAAAAKLNDSAGCLYLARCYADGRGLEKNPLYAYVNFSRAVALGIPTVAAQRDEQKSKLKPTELKEAEEMLKKMLPTKPTE
jgi:TPR repeat protein